MTLHRRQRQKLKPVTLTPAAAGRVRAIMKKRDVGYLRIGVTNGGCAGMEYVMDYVDAPAPGDEKVNDAGVEIVIDAAAILFLLGSQIDYEETDLHAKFVFNNPNQTDACGCGESVTIVPVVQDVPDP